MTTPKAKAERERGAKEKSMRRPIIVSFLVFGLVAFGLARASHGQGLFDSGRLTEAERKSLQSESEALSTVVEGLGLLQIMIIFRGFKQGDCGQLETIEGPAKEGDAKNQWILADLYRQGLCVKKDDKEAANWLIRSAKQGYKSAQLDLGTYYFNGWGLRENHRQAAHWFLKAAEQGDRKSQNFVAKMYEKGDGILQNYIQAIRWYEKAADQGHWKSAISLAYMYIEGRGSQPNLAKGFEWLLKTANAGFKPGQALTAAAYLNGSGVEPNLVQAHKWANLASSSDIAEVKKLAVDFRSKAEKKMKPNEIVEAQELARNWKPSERKRKKEFSISKTLQLARVSEKFSDGLSPEQAKTKLTALGVPVTKDLFFLAVKKDNLGVFKLFHKAGASLETKKLGLTPLFWAVDFGSYKVYRYLMDNQADINAVDQESGQNPLVRAIAHSRWDIVQELLDAGADASQQFGISGELGLSSMSALSISLWGKDNPQLVTQLLNRGASVKERYMHERTPLHSAVSNHLIKTVAILLSAGADVNAKDNTGVTPLHESLDGEKRRVDLELVQLLLANDADLTPKTTRIMSPLLTASIQGLSDVVKLLIDHGAKPNERYRFSRGEIPYIVTDPKLRAVMMNGGTPLMVAAVSGHLSVAKTLSQKGADPTIEIQIGGVSHTASKLARDSGYDYLATAIATGNW